MGLGIYAGVMKVFSFFLSRMSFRLQNFTSDQSRTTKTLMCTQRKNHQKFCFSKIIWKLNIATSMQWRNHWCFLLLFDLVCYTCAIWKIFRCVYTAIDVKSFWAPFLLYSYIQTSHASHREDTKGLNLLCDIGFPLGSHKQRIQRPWISLF